MKKIIVCIALLFSGAFVNAQIGVGFYPLNNMASLRWNPKEIVHDSMNNSFVTNYNYHLELRSSFTLAHNQHGTSVGSFTEAGFFHSIAGKAGKPMLFSGIGALVTLSRNRVNNAGIFIPILIEYVPQFNFTHNLAFDLETDLQMSVNNSNHFNATFNPLFCVSWIFSPPAPKTKS